MSTLEDGWDDDEELEVEDDAVNEPAGGWEDDDAFFDSDDDVDDGTGPNKAPRQQQEQELHARSHEPPQQVQPMNSLEKDQNGWGDDNDNLDLDDGWGHDDADILDSSDVVPDVTNNNSSVPPMSSHPPQTQRIIDELITYIRSLSHMIGSINAVLEFEYNTPTKAEELLEYYSNRPQLAEYTRTKELGRMDYKVVLPHGHVEQDKTQIAENFLSDDSFLARCANQSLLADLIQVITGSDLVVRPQYLAVCVAHLCQFTMHLGDRGDLVDCVCHLQLSLPAADGQRFNIAEIKGSVVFAPGQPMVQYRLTSIDDILEESSFSKLAGTAEFLAMMEGHFDEFPGHPENPQSTPSDMFRDAFLENSHKLFNQSTQGMKSALQQMEAVVNIQQKLQIVKGGYQTISKLLPDTDRMLAADQEAAAMAQQHRQQQMVQAQSRPPQLAPHGSIAPPPPPHSNHDAASRPQSILGGLVRSGWNRLAKSVPVPTEVDETTIQSHPQLYRRDEPHLYRPDETVRLPRPPSPQLPKTQPSQPVLPPPPPPPPLDQNQDASQLASRNDSIFRPPPLPRKSDATESNQQSSNQAKQKQQPSAQLAVEKQVTQGTQSTAKPPVPPSSGPSKQPYTPVLPRPPSGEQVARPQNETLSPTVQNIPKTSPQQPLESIHTSSDTRVAKGKSLTGSNSATYQESNVQHVQHPVGSEKTSKIEPATTAPRNDPSKQEEVVMVHVDYNCEDDIIQTRKRWRNPRPHRPYLMMQ